MKFKKGDVLRKRPGEWCLFRVDETYGHDSPYVFCTLVSTSKFHKAGHEVSLVRIEDAILVEEPREWARTHFMAIDLDVQRQPEARYA